MASALGRECRRNSWDIRKFDSMEMAFMNDIADGRLIVRDTTGRDYERARHLIRYVGVKNAKKISSADALIATCALEFIMETRHKGAVFVSCDLPLLKILVSLDAFRASMKLCHLDKAKQSDVA
jgi:hypothetical protein